MEIFRSQLHYGLDVIVRQFSQLFFSLTIKEILLKIDNENNYFWFSTIGQR